MIETADFTYEDDVHEYRNANRDLVHSATGSLKAAGLIDFSMVDPAVLEDKRDLGDHVHKWTAQHDIEGDADPLEVTEREYRYCKSWLSFKADFQPEFIAIEVPLFGRVGIDEVGGTPDVICMIKRRLWIIDRKCCASVMPQWELQVAIYEMLKTKAPYLGIFGRMSVVLKPNGTYKPVVYQDPNAAAVAKAALAVAYRPEDENAGRILDAWAYNKNITRLLPRPIA